MKQCHVCLHPCDDGAEICPVCGAELLADENSEKQPEQNETAKEIKNPVLAARADSPVTAEIFKDILAENDIPYSVDEQGDIMHVGFGGSYFALDIYVDEKDVETAKELYRNLTESEFPLEDFEDFEGFEEFEAEDAENGGEEV